MKKIDTMKVIREMPAEAISVIEKAFGKEAMSKVTPTIIKPYSNNQAIIFKIVEQDGERSVEVETKDDLIVLPKTEGTLDVYEDEEGKPNDH